MTPRDTIWPPPPVHAPKRQPPRLSWWRKLFIIPEGEATNGQVISWWEARRLTYNLLVFCLGVPSFLLYLLFVSTAATLPPGEDVVEPLSLFIAPIAVPIAVNLCYTLGWIGKLLWRQVSRNRTRHAGRIFMSLGIGFTLFVVLSPSACWGAVWVWHILTGHKVDVL